MLRRHERTVMGGGKARMAGRYPVQVAHEWGQRPRNRCSTVRCPARLSGGPTSAVSLRLPGLVVVRPHPLAVTHAAHCGFRLDDDPATSAPDQVSTPRDRQPALLDEGPKGVDDQFRVPVRPLPRRLRRGVLGSTPGGCRRFYFPLFSLHNI